MHRANRMACATLVINLFKEMGHCKGEGKIPFSCCGCWLNVWTWQRENTHFFIYLLRTLECMCDHARLFHMHCYVCLHMCVTALLCVFVPQEMSVVQTYVHDESDLASFFFCMACFIVSAEHAWICVHVLLHVCVLQRGFWEMLRGGFIWAVAGRSPCVS